MSFKVGLYGPGCRVSSNLSYGGAVGYVTCFRHYLAAFNFDDVTYHPITHSVREKSNYKPFNLVVRLLKDYFKFFKDGKRYNCIHIMAQYRGAILREFVVFLIAKQRKQNVIYDIKAGEFLNWYENTSLFYKLVTNIIVRHSDFVLSEGLAPMEFLRNLNSKILHFSNFVASQQCSPPREINKVSAIKILFIGFCYSGKGVLN